MHLLHAFCPKVWHDNFVEKYYEEKSQKGCGGAVWELSTWLLQVLRSCNIDTEVIVVAFNTWKFRKGGFRTPNRVTFENGAKLEFGAKFKFGAKKSLNVRAQLTRLDSFWLRSSFSLRMSISCTN